MKLNIVIMMILIVLFTGCKTTDQCLRRAVFNECLDKAEIVDYRVIQKCREVSHVMSQRQYKNIREGCK